MEDNQYLEEEEENSQDMSDQDFENEFSFLESISDISIDDIPTCDSKQALEQYKKGGNNCRQIYQLLRWLQQNEEYDQILSILWEMKRYSDSYAKFFGNMYNDLMDNCVRLENEPFEKEDPQEKRIHKQISDQQMREQKLLRQQIKRQNQQQESRELINSNNNQEKLIIKIDQSGQLQQQPIKPMNNTKQEEHLIGIDSLMEETKQNKSNISLSQDKLEEDKEASIENNNELSSSKYYYKLKCLSNIDTKKRNLKGNKILVHSQQNSILNKSRFPLLDKSFQNKRAKIDITSSLLNNQGSLQSQQPLFITENTKRSIKDEFTASLIHQINPAKEIFYMKDHLVSETPKPEEIEENNDILTNPLKVQDFSEMLNANQIDRPAPSNGRGRPRKYPTPNTNIASKNLQNMEESKRTDAVSDNDSSISHLKESQQFNFKKELHNLIKMIQENNTELFQQAMQRGQYLESSYGSKEGQGFSGRTIGRKLNNNQMESIRNSLGPSLQNANAVNGIIKYDQENFFQTQNGALFDTKCIVSYQQFWERVEIFYKIDIQKEILVKLNTFYKLPEDVCHRLKLQLEPILHQDYVNDNSIINSIKLSKKLQMLLDQNDELFRNNYSPEGRKRQTKNDFLKEFKEDLNKERLLLQFDGKLSKNKSLFKNSSNLRSRQATEGSLGRGNSAGMMNEDDIINSDDGGSITPKNFKSSPLRDIPNLQQTQLEQQNKELINKLYSMHILQDMMSPPIPTQQLSQNSNDGFGALSQLEQSINLNTNGQINSMNNFNQSNQPPIQIDKLQFRIPKQCPDIGPSDFQIAQEKRDQKVFRNENDFIMSKLVKLNIIESDEYSQVDNGSNDEVSYIISKLKKQAFKYKGLNTLQLRRLKDKVIKIRNHEKSVASILAKDPKVIIKEIKAMNKRQKDTIAKRLESKKKKEQLTNSQQSISFGSVSIKANRRISEKQVHTQPKERAERSTRNHRLERLIRNDRESVGGSVTKREKLSQNADVQEEQEKESTYNQQASKNLTPLLRTPKNEQVQQDLFQIDRNVNSKPQRQEAAEKRLQSGAEQSPTLTNSKLSSPNQGTSSKITIAVRYPNSLALNVQPVSIDQSKINIPILPKIQQANAPFSNQSSLNQIQTEQMQQQTQIIGNYSDEETKQGLQIQKQQAISNQGPKSQALKLKASSRKVTVEQKQTTEIITQRVLPLPVGQSLLDQITSSSQREEIKSTQVVKSSAIEMQNQVQNLIRTNSIKEAIQGQQLITETSGKKEQPIQSQDNSNVQNEIIPQLQQFQQQVQPQIFIQRTEQEQIQVNQPHQNLTAEQQFLADEQIKRDYQLYLQYKREMQREKNQLQQNNQQIQPQILPQQQLQSMQEYWQQSQLLQSQQPQLRQQINQLDQQQKQPQQQQQQIVQQLPIDQQQYLIQMQLQKQRQKQLLQQQQKIQQQQTMSEASLLDKNYQIQQVKQTSIPNYNQMIQPDQTKFNENMNNTSSMIINTYKSNQSIQSFPNQIMQNNTNSNNLVMNQMQQQQQQQYNSGFSAQTNMTNSGMNYEMRMGSRQVQNDPNGLFSSQIENRKQMQYQQIHNQQFIPNNYRDFSNYSNPKQVFDVQPQRIKTPNPVDPFKSESDQVPSSYNNAYSNKISNPFGNQQQVSSQDYQKAQQQNPKKSNQDQLQSQRPNKDNSSLNVVNDNIEDPLGLMRQNDIDSNDDFLDHNNHDFLD